MIKTLTLEQAELFHQEAVTTYEKAACRFLVGAIQENNKLRDLIENLHLHYNPGMPGFDIEAALQTLPTTPA